MRAAPPLLSFRRARLQFIVLMLITSHWFACIWGMCADLQGEDYESFTWLDALYYAKSPPGPAGAWLACFFISAVIIPASILVVFPPPPVSCIMFSII